MFGTRDKEILTELTAIRLGIQYLLDTMFEEAPLLYREAKAVIDSKHPDVLWSGFMKADEYAQGSDAFDKAKSEFLKQREPFTSADIIVTDHAKTWENEMKALLGDDTELMRAFAKEHGLQAYEAVKNGNVLAVDLFREFSTPSANSTDNEDNGDAHQHQ